MGSGRVIRARMARQPLRRKLARRYYADTRSLP